MYYKYSIDGKFTSSTIENYENEKNKNESNKSIITLKTEINDNDEYDLGQPFKFPKEDKSENMYMTRGDFKNNVLPYFENKIISNEEINNIIDNNLSRNLNDYVKTEEMNNNINELRTRIDLQTDNINNQLNNLNFSNYLTKESSKDFVTFNKLNEERNKIMEYSDMNYVNKKELSPIRTQINEINKKEVDLTNYVDKNLIKEYVTSSKLDEIIKKLDNKINNNLELSLNSVKEDNLTLDSIKAYFETYILPNMVTKKDMKNYVTFNESKNMIDKRLSIYTPVSVNISTVNLNQGLYFKLYSIYRNFNKRDLLKKGVLKDEINFNWKSNKVMGVRKNRLTITFDGYVTVPKSGVWRFMIYMNDGANLSIGGKVLVYSYRRGRSRKMKGYHIYLKKGEFYPINLEYLDYLGWASLKLYWSYENESYSIVPLRNLFSKK